MSFEINPADNSTTYAVSVIGLNKSFSEKALFRDFSYSFKPTGIYALIGESGRGKTTLLRIIAGLDKDYSGSVYVNGKISLCFQEHRLFPTLTALENLTQVLFENPTESDTARAMEMLTSLGLTESECALYPRQLSGGMRQRVSLARALLADADILLLDEPTKELDATHRAAVREKIERYANDRLVILVSHSSEDLDRLKCEKVVL